MTMLPRVGVFLGDAGARDGHESCSIFAEPLLDQEAHQSDRQTEDKAREPKGVYQWCLLRRDEASVDVRSDIQSLDRCVSDLSGDKH